ncbi:cytochrome c [Flavobacterium franklandianum]|uniref:Cytochrome c n=1 Tax=Flavobacterium franklandianum TaxID=2594430 RepID=A0A553C6S8_9FLAO|nr:cytochrome c [Flavobacterium franklandianum]TRX16237.1 cytochrome c [Flavobacterium franklandianum]TRX25120.1 cytochrome c [Flavobacterium franklandianum]
MKSNYLFLVAIASLFFVSNSIFAQKNWAVPEYTKALKNPFEGNKAATAEGKVIYGQMCVLCHGITGKGNGEAGLSLEKKPTNFLALKNMSDETDGEIFWKITVGKPPMSSYDELLTEDQRWQLVNYIRQLNKNK